MLGEAKKAWLGEDQEKGIEGLGTARRRMGRGVGVVGLSGGAGGHESATVV